MCVSPENVIRLKVSRGFSPSSASCMVSLAFSMGKPDMEPEVSSTKTSSLGVASAGATRSGGCSSRVKNPPLPARWVSTASSTCLPATA